MNKLTKSAAGLIIALSAFSFLSCDDEPNIIGLDDAAKYGAIKLTFEGERPDGEDFKETKNFRFIPGDNPGYYSTVNVSEDGATYYSFNVTRQFDPFDGDSENYADIELYTMNDDGEEIINNLYLNIYTPIVSDDNVAFEIYFNQAIDTEDVTSYSYNEETGKLTLKFSTEIDGENNPTGNDLTVTGEIRVTVYTSLNSGD